MPLSLVDFWKRLLQSGMADESAPRQWAAEFANDHDSTPPSDPLTLAKWLVKTGRLKPFQAACLTRPAPNPDGRGEQNGDFRFPVLRIAPLTQAAEQPRSPFARWLPVTHQSYPDQSGVLLQISPAGLTPLDGDRLRWLAAFQHAGLPNYELMALTGAPLGNYFTTLALDTSLDAIGLFALVPPGESLAEKCSRESTTRWTTTDIVPLIQTLAGAMSQLEDGQLAFPPMPSPDRIWIPHETKPATKMEGRSSAILWIDPAEYLSPDALGCSRTMASTESRSLYAAPETMAGGAVDASSWAHRSIYALGCLAYRLRFGHHAFAAAQEEQIRSRQLRFEPPELSGAVTQGAAGDPLLRVLAYAVAKDPQSRFASFEAFTQALAATLPIAKPDSTPATVPKPSAQNEPAPPAKSELAADSRQTRQPVEKSVTTEPALPVASAPSALNAPAPVPAQPPRSTESPVTKSPVTKTPDAAAALAEPTVSSETRQRDAPVAGKPMATAEPMAAAEPAAAKTPPASRAPDVSQRDAAAIAGSAREGSPDPEPAPIAGAPHHRARRPSRRRTAWFVLGSLWIPIILLIFALARQDPDAPRPVAKRTRPRIPAVIPSVTGNRRTPPGPRSPGRRSPGRRPSTEGRSDDQETIEIVSDDRMLWAPPSALAAASESDSRGLAATMLLPPGPAALTTFNLPNLNAIGLRDAFDPELSPVWEQLQKRIAVPIEDVRLLALAWFPGSEGVPEIAMAVHLKSPRTLDELTQAWEASLAVVPGGAKIYAGDDPDGDAYYPHLVTNDASGPTNADGPAGAGGPKGASDQSDQSTDESAPGTTDTPRVDAFAIGSIARMTQVAEVEGAAVLLPRQLEEIWQSSRPTDAIAMLSVPNFLIADSRAWIQQAAPPLLDWIRATLTPECGGLLVRVVAAPPSQSDPVAGSRGSYVELRLAMTPGKDPAALKSKVFASIDEASAAAEGFLLSREVDPSWRLLAARLPSMWMFTGEQIRSAAIKREVIFNAYLPPLALPQLALGTLLAANTTATTATVVADKPIENLTIEEMLDRPMSVSFGQESLQFAIDTIINEFAAELPDGNQAPAIEIIGGDLQKMGITQNQQVRNFSKQDLPLRTVLTDLMLGANPDRTATGPADPKQALIWVVVDDGDAAEIKITTREAAKGKYELPKEFQMPD